MAKHNKKRNVGLLHEQLVRYASENLVTGNKENAELAVELLKTHFRDDSALQKEFKLFNALIHTKVPTREIAQQIITESRIACQNHKKNELSVGTTQVTTHIPGYNGFIPATDTNLLANS